MLELAILGALKEKPMHGYELKKRLTFMLGHLWKISFGSLYPALKRLEAKQAIERAYTVKEKARNRYVYRITPEGERLFQELLTRVESSSDITDSDRFSLRLVFFRYLDPEARIRLLERRRNYLLEKLNEMMSWGKGRERESDSYRVGLFRHRQELMRSDIDWLNHLIERERSMLSGESAEADSGKDEKGGEGLVSGEEVMGNFRPMQA